VQGAALSGQGLGSRGNWSDKSNWNGVNTPANGDTLIFPAGQPRLSNTSNIANLTLGALAFSGASGSYAIYSNAITRIMRDPAVQADPTRLHPQ
jgi:hypothetical protein